MMGRAGSDHAKTRSDGARHPLRTVVIVLIALTMVVAIADEVVFADRILPGVHIGPLDVGWMKRSDAADKLSRGLSRSRVMSIVWTGGTRRLRINGDDFGIDALAAANSAYEAGRVGDVLVRFDARLSGLGRGFQIHPVTRPKGTVKSALEEAGRVLSEPAVDAHYSLAGGKIRVVPGKHGMRLDERSGATELADGFLGDRKAVHLPTLVVEPLATTRDATRLLREARVWADGPVKLVVGPRTVSLSPGTILDSTAIRDRKLVIDPSPLARRLDPVAEAIRRSPSDARFNVRRNRVFIVGGTPGRVVDMAATARKLAKALHAGSRRAVAVVQPIQPTVLRSDLAAMGITKLLSTFTTTFTVDQDGRDINIALAARAVHGKVLTPGETFSLNKATGPRNRHTGYKESLVFSNGKVVPGIGGGVCQVSSTLYEAALLADLRIVKRYNHSMAVSYVPPGRDATAFYPTVDLSFQNSRDSAILLWSSVIRNRLTMQVFGSGNKPKVTIKTFVRKTTPPKTRVVYDSKLPTGKRVVESVGRPGYIVSSYRLVWQGNRVVRREFLATDKYRPKASIVRVGT